MKNLIKLIKKAFGEYKVEPTQKFSNKLRDRLVLLADSDETSLSPRKRKLFFNTRLMKNKLFIALVLILLFISVSVIFFELFNHKKTEKHAEIKLITLSQVEQDKVFESISKSDALATIQSGRTGQVFFSEGFLSGKNYRYSRTVENWGKGLDQCPDENITGLRDESVSYQYDYRSTEGIYSKYVQILNDKQIINYQLSLDKVTARKDEHYEFAGGEFATKRTDTYVASAYDGEPLTQNSLGEIKSQFGSDYTMYKTNISGTDYYLIEVKDQEQCNGKERTIISNSYIDASTFEITKTEDYVDSRTEANLISRQTIQVEHKDLTLAEANQLFKFDINVPVKKVTSVPWQDTSKITKQVTEDFFNKKDLTVLLPTSFEATGVFGSPSYLSDVLDSDTTKYLNDRKFYPTGEVGDILYQHRTTATSNKSDYNLGFSGKLDNQRMSFTYGQHSKADDVMFGDMKEVSKTYFYINNEKVDLQIHMVIHGPMEGSLYHYNGTFHYGNYYYDLMASSQKSNFDFTKIKLKTTSTSDQGVSEYILKMIAKNGY